MKHLSKYVMGFLLGLVFIALAQQKPAPTVTWDQALSHYYQTTTQIQYSWLMFEKELTDTAKNARDQAQGLQNQLDTTLIPELKKACSGDFKVEKGIPTCTPTTQGKPGATGATGPTGKL